MAFAFADSRDFVEYVKGQILVGTASWSDPGFVERWYPKKLPAGERLRWYAQHFDLAPEVGFEPTTNRLTADRSTTELLWIGMRH